MKEKHEEAKWIILGVLLVLVEVSIGIDIVLTLQTSAKLDTLRSYLEVRLSRPCVAVPAGLILEDPACASKLVSVMNVSNVRVLPREAYLARAKQVNVLLRNVSGSYCELLSESDDSTGLCVVRSLT